MNPIILHRESDGKKEETKTGVFDSEWIQAVTLRCKAAEEWLSKQGIDSVPQDHAIGTLIRSGIPSLLGRISDLENAFASTPDASSPVLRYVARGSERP